eukprot:501276_1
MGYCLTVLFRIYGPKIFIQEFLSQFTWRGTFNIILLRGRGIIPNEDFTKDYNTFSTHYKYYYDTTQNNGTLSEKKEALKQFADQSVVNKILDFSEIYSGEICYAFKIWKDNWKGGSNDDDFGVSANIRRIYQRVLKLHRDHIPKLKFNQNFKLSFTILERSDLIYSNIDAKTLFDYLNGSDMFKKDYFSYNILQPVSLPSWNTPYPVVKVYNKIFDDSTNKFSNEEWIDFTQQMRAKLEMQNDLKFRKGRTVQLINLKKKEWNGLRGTIVAEYEFKAERWPIHIQKPINKKVLIKAINLKQINQR